MFHRRNDGLRLGSPTAGNDKIRAQAQQGAKGYLTTLAGLMPSGPDEGLGHHTPSQREVQGMFHLAGIRLVYPYQQRQDGQARRVNRGPVVEKAAISEVRSVPVGRSIEIVVPVIVPLTPRIKYTVISCAVKILSIAKRASAMPFLPSSSTSAPESSVTSTLKCRKNMLIFAYTQPRRFDYGQIYCDTHQRGT